MNQQVLANQLRQEAERLIKAADLLSPQQQTTPVPPTPKIRIGSRRLSKDARRKLSEAQQKRRARERAEKEAKLRQMAA